MGEWSKKGALSHWPKQRGWAKLETAVHFVETAMWAF
jgi:hypothetical protein